MASELRRVNGVDYIVVPLTSGTSWRGRMGRPPQPRLKSEEPRGGHARQCEVARTNGFEPTVEFLERRDRTGQGGER